MRLALSPLRRACGRYRQLSTFAERDIVLLRPKSNYDAPPVLTRPLDPANKIQTHKGAISHADIIGKSPRDLVTSSSGQDFRICHVTLAEYVALSRRLVTPIYPADANLIVSLFDLHPSPNQDSDKLEILEAGTGHGALTLHLSRAIHGANPPKPTAGPGLQDLESLPVNTTEASQSAEPSSHNGDSNGESDGVGESDAMRLWKASRKAIIHTIDISSKYSKHAAKTVRSFRHGLYADNVDFHVGDVSEWIGSELSRRSPGSTTPFLSHAFLDLPSTHDHLSTVASALHVDGVLIVFNPSITQITECVQKLKRERIPLMLDQTLELGNNGTSGGRPWDVRAVKLRAPKKAEIKNDAVEKDGTSDLATANEGSDVTRDPDQILADPGVADSEFTLVCRPKVGDRVVGGGFLGVFRKMRDIAHP